MDDRQRIYDVYLQAIENGIIIAIAEERKNYSSNPSELAWHQTNIIQEMGGRRMRDRGKDISYFLTWLRAYADAAEEGGPDQIWHYHRSEYITRATAIADQESIVIIPVIPAVIPPVISSVVPEEQLKKIPDIVIVITIGVILALMVVILK